MRRMNFTLPFPLIYLLVGALFLPAWQAAWAQSAVVPASERMSAAHEPMGVRVRSFLVIPKVDVDGQYKDNIYATSTNTTHDFITTVRPEISAKSKWSRHQVNVLARGEFKRYARKSKENQNNYLLAADGRLDVLRSTNIGGGVAFTQEHEERGDPNTPSSAREPTEFKTLTAKAGIYRGIGRANARFDTEAKKFDYRNNLTTTGTVIDNNQRDRVEYTQTLRLGYQFDPRFEAFVSGAADTRNYDRKGGASVNRSNHGMRLVAGSAFDMTGKTKGEAYAGMVRRKYVDTALKDISEPTWGGKATWNASELTTVIASADRTIEETTLGASSGYVSSLYTAMVEHALTRDILLTARTGYELNDYKGTAISQRKDKIWRMGAGVDYYFNRSFKAGLQYAYQNRNSNVGGGSYNDNAVLLRLTAAY